MYSHSKIPAQILRLALVIVLSLSSARAQNDVQVSTTVLPPYSPYLSDYVGIDNKIIVNLTNTTQQDLDLRLIGSFEGLNNGIEIAIPMDFKPAQPIKLAPLQSKLLMGLQLKEYINPDVMTFQGISKQEVVQGNGLPEGDYRFCMRAIAYNSNEALSQPAPSGCAQFEVTHYETPQLTQPECDAIVNAQNPQSLLFAWTIPAGAPPNKVEYVLKIAEMFPNDVNPTQAILAATDPPFFEKVVKTNSYLYNLADTKLEEGHRYAVRVTARATAGNQLNFKNNGHSVACWFQYGQEQQQQQNEPDDEEQEEQEQIVEEDVDLDENYANPCEILNCAPQPLASGPPSGKEYKIGDEVQVGYFIMKLTSVANGASDKLTGEGEIDAPLFNTKLKATFQNLKVNAAHKVYQGKAIGAYDPGAQVDQALKDYSNNLGNIAEEKVKTVTDYVKTHQKYVENFVDVQAQGLPFAWNKLFNSKLQLVNIVAIEFAPDGARLNACLNFQIPEANNKIIAFAQKNVCFHPTGLSVDGLQKLTMLGNDKTFNWGQNVTVKLKAANGNNGCFVKWDCEGYKEMQLHGEFIFAESLLENADGNGPVKAGFKFTAAAWGEMIGAIDMDPFVVKGFKGMRMDFNQVVLDYSDSKNAEGMSFPVNYNGNKGNDWRGFYFKQIDVTLPDYLKQNKQNIKITMSNALINKMGFTGKVKVQPVFNLDKGNLGGWAFSMDKFALAFVNNSLTEGKFEGKLKIPVAQTGLGYKCLLSNSNQGVKTAFEVSNLDDINVPMWGASLSIYNGSSVSVTAVNNDVTVKAILSGDLTIDKQFASLKNVAVKIPDVKFQNFKIQNKKPYLSADYFKFSSPQKSFAGFPVSIKPTDGITIKFKNNGTMAGIQLGFHVGLDGNGQSALSGGTSFTIWGQMEEQNGKQTWQLAKPELNSIYLKANIAACEIEGSINLYNGDPTFGDGFKGSLKVTFRPLIELSATVQFGSTKYNNGNQRYRYWYFDAMAKLNAGIMVYPGFGIYGFGGGAYYHMEPTKAMPNAAALDGDPDQVANFDQDTPGQSSTGVTYKPNPGIAFGFKATIIMGTMPSPKAFNGDLTLEMNFNNGGGINMIAISGAGYFVSVPDPQNRPGDDAIITATAEFVYSNELKSFDGLIDINFNIKVGNKTIIEGGGDVAMHFSSGKWFIKFGTPDSPMPLNVLDLLEIKSYFMIGKNSLGPMPDLPTEPINFKAHFPTFNQKNPRSPSTELGSGFAFGQQLNINTGEMTFLIFYARIAISFGYDISILNLDAVCDKIPGKMGLNGWYAQGQVYAGLEASVGMRLNLWFAKADVELFNVGIYAGLKAGLPNPTWLKGAVKGTYSVMNGLLSGSCTFHFETGEYCDVSEGDPFGGLKIIADLQPIGGDVDVYAFPQVAFNLPVGKDKVIAVEALDENDELTVIKFRFGIKKFEVRKKSNNAKIAGAWRMVNKKMSAIFEPKEMLPEKTEYIVSVRIHGDRLVNGSWKRIKKCKNCTQDHVEPKDKEFKTGEAPEHFRQKDVISTTPRRLQRYFHPAESQKAAVRMIQFPTHIAQLKPEDSRYKYVYFARFFEIKAGAKQVGGSYGLWWSNTNNFKGVRFTMPDLKPKTLYIAKIIRKKKLKQGQQAPQDNFKKFTTYKYLGAGQKMKVRRTRLDGFKLGDDEFLVYQMAFKTSKHYSFKKKMDKYLSNKKSVTRGNGANYNRVYAKYKGDEPLDWYDMYQTVYKKNDQYIYTAPTVRLKAIDMSSPTENNPYWSYLHYRYYKYGQKDYYINGTYIGSEKGMNITNPRMYRTYPGKTIYAPGSRVTNNTHLSQVHFPQYAVALRYEGNGLTGRLTNSEINAVFWKDFNMNPSPGPAKKGPVFKLGKIIPKNPQMMAQNQFAQAEHNTLVILYDVANVLKRDRKKIADELTQRYGATLAKTPQFWSFMKYNASAQVAQDLAVQGYDYWNMNLHKSTKMKVRITASGYLVDKEVVFKLD